MARFWVLTVLILAVSGCASRESRVVGKWKGKIELSKSLDRSPLGAMAKGFAGMADPEIDLKPDMTFTLYLGPIPTDGTWKFSADGKSIELTPKSTMGMNPEEVSKKADEGMRRMSGMGLPLIGMSLRPGQPFKLMISDDWRTLSLEQPGSKPGDGFGDLTFTKV